MIFNIKDSEDEELAPVWAEHIGKEYHESIRNGFCNIPGIETFLNAHHNEIDDSIARWIQAIIERCYGLYMPMPRLKLDDIDSSPPIAVGPISFSSICPHHLLPIIGECRIVMMPKDQALGLSKYARLARWVYARPGTQEDLTNLLASILIDETEALGVLVQSKAMHTCMSWRGAQARESSMIILAEKGIYADIKTETEKAFALSLMREL